MRWSVALVVAVLAACQQQTTPDFAAVFDGTAGRWVDLAHAFSESNIYWPTDTEGFQLKEFAFGPTEGGWFYASYTFCAPEHEGTHLDAPARVSAVTLAAGRVWKKIKSGRSAAWNMKTRPRS
jgi:hypothetical protein